VLRIWLETYRQKPRLQPLSTERQSANTLGLNPAEPFHLQRSSDLRARIYGEPQDGLPQRPSTRRPPLGRNRNDGCTPSPWLGSAYGWNKHGSCFLSAQRHRVSNSEDWRIAESEYRKFAIPSKVSLVLGDVVASGTSLQHALLTMIDAIKHRGAELCSILFFTIGGHRSEAVFQELEERILAEHPNYKGSTVIYFEGRFPVASPETPLRIKLTGTDLLRHGDTMAPEFLESQYQNPMFPVERCTIYDAGSRAFEPEVYLEDVLEYWKAVLALDPLSFADYLAERCPLLDPNRFQNVSLRELAASQVQRIEQQRAFFSH